MTSSSWTSYKPNSLFLRSLTHTRSRLIHGNPQSGPWIAWSATRRNSALLRRRLLVRWQLAALLKYRRSRSSVRLISLRNTCQFVSVRVRSDDKRTDSRSSIMNSVLTRSLGAAARRKSARILAGFVNLTARMSSAFSNVPD